MYGTLAKRIDTLDANEMPDHDDEMYYKPFKYLHLGTLAYIGNSYVWFFLLLCPSSFVLLPSCSFFAPAPPLPIRQIFTPLTCFTRSPMKGS
jgi:hypothetical protein